jgi:signal transduction histidine kinase
MTSIITQINWASLLWSSILIENAIKYSSAGGSVDISLQENGDNIVLEVKDEGYGIPDSEKKKVFEKFYRVGNEDTRNAKGTGLGLFIVSRFVEIYKGEIDPAGQYA